VGTTLIYDNFCHVWTVGEMIFILFCTNNLLVNMCSPLTIVLLHLPCNALRQLFSISRVFFFFSSNIVTPPLGPPSSSGVILHGYFSLLAKSPSPLCVVFPAYPNILFAQVIL
jgi:hypothetical protein